MLSILRSVVIVKMYWDSLAVIPITFVIRIIFFTFFIFVFFFIFFFSFLLASFVFVAVVLEPNFDLLKKMMKNSYSCYVLCNNISC